MALPLGTCADEISTDVCCRSIFDIAERLRQVAFGTVADCYEPCGEYRTYVSVGPRVSEAMSDAVLVYITDVTPSIRTRSSTGQTTLGVSLQQAQFEIFLTETGWPMIEGNELGEVIYVPDHELVNAVSRHAYSHAEAMYRAVLNSYQKGLMFPLPANSHINKVEIAGLRPIAPSAHTVGWVIPVAVQFTFPASEPGPVNATILAPMVEVEGG